MTYKSLVMMLFGRGCGLVVRQTT